MKQSTVLKISLCVAIVLSIVAINLMIRNPSEVKEPTIIYVNPPYESDAAHGKQYLTVMTDFQNCDFTNITYEEIDDLIFGWLTKDGEVEKVEINGSTEYTVNSTYNQSEVHVVIYYHTFPEKIETNYNTETQIEQNTETVETTLDNLMNESSIPEQTETEIKKENIESTNYFKIYAEDTISTLWDKGLRYGDTLEIQGKLHSTKDGDYYIGYAYSDVEIVNIPNKNIIYVDNYETLSYIEFEEEIYNSKSHKGIDKCKFCKVIGTLSNNNTLENVSLYFDDISYEYEVDVDELINECIAATKDQIHIDLPFSDINKYNYKWIRIRGVYNRSK